MNLDELQREVARLADDRMDETLIRILTADIPEFGGVPKHCCTKCGPLLREYIGLKIAAHHSTKEWECRPFQQHYPLETRGPRLEMSLERARTAFHQADCDCGLELWRGKNWRSRQSEEYQELWKSFVMKNSNSAGNEGRLT